MSLPDDVCRILVCEDSIPFAEGLTHFLQLDPQLRVVAHCLTGEEAVVHLSEADPDVVIMDIELPGIDGVEATRRITAARPLPVLVLSSRTRRGSQLALASLEAGAIDVRAKEDVTLESGMGARALAFRRYLKRLAATNIARRREVTGSSESATPWRHRSISVIALASSTGGPQALRTVLGSLPADFPVPIVVVQHMAPGFVAPLIEWLDGQVGLAVNAARDCATLGPGAWIAPDDAHLLLDEDLVTRFDTEIVAGHQRPAADLLLVSMASAAGPEAVAAVLTGMGDDGADGISAVRRSGGLTIAQADASAIIDGMPRAAAAMGAEEVVPLADIGPALISAWGGRSPRRFQGAQT